MDIGMPVMDGLQAAEEIFKRRDIPIVVLTGNSDAAVLGKVCALGAFGFVLKPASIPQICSTLFATNLKFREMKALKEKNARLEETLQTRKQIDKAKAVLISRGLTEQEAHRKLQTQSQAENVPIRAIAERVMQAAATLDSICKPAA